MPAHQELEKKLVATMRNMQCVEDYARLLQLFYRYFGGLERLIEKFIDEATLPDYDMRRKAALIGLDLETLNAPLPATAALNELPVIKNTQEALGALYVMEGSTLGGQVIKGMLARQLNIDDDFATLFFNGYGTNTGQMWQSFKQALDRYGSPENDRLIIDAANQTFQKFSGLFDNHYEDT